MDNRRYEPDEPLEPEPNDYYKAYRLWLNDFGKTDDYKKMVDDYKMDWIKLCKELCRIFEHTVWLKEPDEPIEPDLNDYYKEYRLWLNDFRKTDEYKKMVVDYNTDWIKIYKELGRIFEHEVWLKENGYWLTKQYLMDRESKKIVYYDSYTLEPDEDLSYYKK